MRGCCDRFVAAGRLDRGWLVAVATELGLETAAFPAALDREELTARVAADAELGRSIGIDVTPGFVVGGYLLVSERSFEELTQVIEFGALDAGAPLP